MRPGAEGFRARFECTPVDLTARLAEHMENAIPSALIHPEGNEERLKSYLKDDTLQLQEIQSSSEQGEIRSHVVEFNKFEFPSDFDLEQTDPETRTTETTTKTKREKTKAESKKTGAPVHQLRETSPRVNAFQLQA